MGAIFFSEHFCVRLMGKIVLHSQKIVFFKSTRGNSFYRAKNVSICSYRYSKFFKILDTTRNSFFLNFSLKSVDLLT